MLKVIQNVDDLLPYREDILRLLDRVSNAKGVLHVVTMENLLAGITTARELLVLDLDGDGAVKSLVTVELVGYPKLLVFRINGLAGEYDEGWVEKLAHLEEWGIAHGAEACEFWARPCFQRFLRKAGYRVSMFNYVKEFKKDGRQQLS